MTTFEMLKDTMDSNGYAYFDKDAFLHDATKVCYIPENAESLDECFTYLDLKDEVETFVKNNPNYLIEHETTIEAILYNMFESLEWEFPVTWLEQLTY